MVVQPKHPDKISDNSVVISAQFQQSFYLLLKLNHEEQCILNVAVVCVVVIEKCSNFKA